MKRREFIQKSAFTTVGSLLIPSFLKAFEQNAITENNDKILVIIQLSGGNDGLNTVVPYTNDIYYKSRPTIAIEKSQILSITDELGFNPAMQKMRKLYDDGMLSIINSVGYPNPDRSHFRSMDIWHTASSSDEYLSTGWLGRYLDNQCAGGCHSYHAIEVDDTLSLVLKGEKTKAMAMQNPAKLYQSTQLPFIKAINQQNVPDDHSNISYLYKTLAETVSSAEYIYNKSKVQKSSFTYTGGELANRLKTVSELILSGVPTKVYYLALSGFDTHVRQVEKQNNLLENYSEAVYSFVQDLKANNMMDKVLVMTFSEFGRRVSQNGSNGTDHGTANNVFLIGNKLKKAGLYNKAPQLTNLDNGDLVYEIDFRNIYASLLKNWLNVESELILGKKFDNLGVF
jgi:uncharacterized protein (DUF1501 family)